MHNYHFLKTEPGLNQRPQKRRRMTPAVAMPNLPPQLQMMFSMPGAQNMQPFITFKLEVMMGFGSAQDLPPVPMEISIPPALGSSNDENKP